MSFTPGEGGAGLPNIGSLVGSGIDITDINGIDYIATNLVAGPNIQLTPSVVDNSITIAALGGGGGISNVSSTAGSGIITTNILPSGVELSSGLVAGTGIQFVAGAPGPTAKNLTINNTQTVSAGVGSGLVLTPAGTNTSFATNLQSGTGIVITPSTTTNAVQIGNTGVTQVTAGPGVAVSQGTGNVTIAATGVSQVQAGAGIAVSPGQTPTVTNIGVTALNAGPGISVSTSTGQPTIANTGVTQVVAGSGIAVSGNGTGTVTITNTDPTPATIVAGSGISVNTAGGNTTIANTGVLAVQTGLGVGNLGTATAPQLINTGVNQINVGGVGGLLITGSQQLPVIQNTGVLSVTAGPGVSITGPANAPTISAAGVLNQSVQAAVYTQILFDFGVPTYTVPFTLPTWWNQSNSYMRVKVAFMDSQQQNWPGTNTVNSDLLLIVKYAVGGITFQSVFVPLNKPQGTTTLNITLDYITFFRGIPDPGSTAIWIGNSNSGPTNYTCDGYSVGLEYIQVQGGLSLSYQPWPPSVQGGTDNGGQAIITNYSVGYLGQT